MTNCREGSLVRRSVRFPLSFAFFPCSPRFEFCVCRSVYVSGEVFAEGMGKNTKASLVWGLRSIQGESGGGETPKRLLVVASNSLREIIIITMCLLNGLQIGECASVKRCFFWLGSFNCSQTSWFGWNKCMFLPLLQRCRYSHPK